MTTLRFISAATVALALAAGFSCGGGATDSKPPTTPTSGEDKPADKTSKMALPGDCVDPVVDGELHDSSRPFNAHVQPDPEAGDDLDGDGEPEIVVMPAWNCGDSCRRSVYVMRGKCGHYVGTFASQKGWRFLPETTKGMHDISARPRRVGDDSELHCFNVIWKYDGTTYKESKQRECECKAEGAKCTSWEDSK